MWQKCPICNGTGRVKNDMQQTSSFSICSVCNGTKIISELNGLPPNYEQNIRTSKANIQNKIPDNLKNYPSTDFRDGDFESQQQYFGK